MSNSFRNRNLLLMVLASVFVLAVIMGIFVLQKGPSSHIRGNLPYYSTEGNEMVTMKRIGSLEEEYSYLQGAIIVKLIGDPSLEKTTINFEPGSAEGKIHDQSGAISTPSVSYYTMKAQVVDVVSNRSLTISEQDAITLYQSTLYQACDPLYQYSQINKDQMYLIFVYYDSDKNVYNYTYRAAYYVSEGYVYATNNTETIDQYSGLTIDQMAKELNSFQPIVTIN